MWQGLVLIGKVAFSPGKSPWTPQLFSVQNQFLWRKKKKKQKSQTSTHGHHLQALSSSLQVLISYANLTNLTKAIADTAVSNQSCNMINPVILTALQGLHRWTRTLVFPVGGSSVFLTWLPSCNFLSKRGSHLCCGHPLPLWSKFCSAHTHWCSNFALCPGLKAYLYWETSLYPFCGIHLADWLLSTLLFSVEIQLKYYIPMWKHVKPQVWDWSNSLVWS